MQILEGKFDAVGHSYGIVAARFNQPITQLLLEGTLDCLKRHSVADEDITVAWVPGAFEIPLVAKKMAESGAYDGIICIGAVIRGETPHFDYVAGQAASGILQASLGSGIPVIFAVLTCDTKEQAEVRAGTKGANLGFSYALSAIEMVNLNKSLSLNPSFA
jgi:6,7-dimethyl-8-ribityllumazine synthase